MLSGVAFGGNCNNDDGCDYENKACSTTTYGCSSSAFRSDAGSACVLSRFYNRITKTEWVNEPSLNIHLQRPKCCSTPVLLP